MDELRNISDPNIFISKNKINPSGILSENIFGPISGTACGCGASKNKPNDYICSICGGEQISFKERYTRFAKISDLKYFYIKKKDISKLSEIFGPNFKKLLTSFNFKTKKTSTFYLSIELKKTGTVFNLTKDKRENSLNFEINGIFSLYVGLLILEVFQPKYVDDIKRVKELFSNEFLILPPNCRLSLEIKGKNKKFVISQIDKLYSKLLTFHNYAERPNYDYFILAYSTSNTLDESDFDKHESSAYYQQYLIDNLYSEVFSELSGKTGLVRHDFIGKTIDFSGRAVIIPDFSIKPYQLKIPKRLFFDIFSLEYFHFLKTIKNVDIPFLRDIVEGNSTSKFNLGYYDEFMDFFKTLPIEKRVVNFNRQPTLWKWGVMALEVIGFTDEYVIRTNPIIWGPLGMDADGDTAAIYKTHSKKSNTEIYNNMFLGNFKKYEHNNNYLHTASLEILYSFNYLRDVEINNNLPQIQINSISDLPEDFNNYLNVDQPVSINNRSYPYSLIFLNKICLNTNVETFKKSTDLNKFIDLNTNDSVKYNDVLNDAFYKLYYILSINPNMSFSLPVEEAFHVGKIKKEERHSKYLKNLPNNPTIGIYLYDKVVNNIIKELDKSTVLYRLFHTKFSVSQFARSLVAGGYISDDMNKILSEPIKSSVIEGLTDHEFFQSSFGTRKGLVDKEKSVPESGYIQRSITMNLSPIEICEDDCGTTRGIFITVKSYEHAESLLYRYFKFKQNDNWQFIDGNFDLNILINSEIYLRSPISCKTPNNKLCSKCFGGPKLNTNKVGILTGQYISERLTQTSMSSFHTSGSATILKNKELFDFLQIKNFIVDVDDYHVKLIFDENIPSYIFDIVQNNQDFYFVKTESKNALTFLNNIPELNNQDVSSYIKTLNNLIKSSKDEGLNPVDDYLTFITILLKFGKIYSNYVELLFSAMYFFCNKKDQSDIISFRYIDSQTDISNHFIKRFGIKRLHTIISPIISLIYQPNKKSIQRYYLNSFEKQDIENLSIYELFWVNNT